MGPVKGNSLNSRGDGRTHSPNSRSRGQENTVNIRPLYVASNWHQPGYNYKISSSSGSANSSFSTHSVDSRDASCHRSKRSDEQSSYSHRSQSSIPRSTSTNSSFSNGNHSRSSASSNSDRSSSGALPPFETNPVALARRQKQIDYGKHTIEYHTYLQRVPKESRKVNHPQTPDRNKKCSRRSFDGEIKIWRLLLHAYNPQNDLKSEGGELILPNGNKRCR